MLPCLCMKIVCHSKQKYVQKVSRSMSKPVKGESRAAERLVAGDRGGGAMSGGTSPDALDIRAGTQSRMGIVRMGVNVALWVISGAEISIYGSVFVQSVVNSTDLAENKARV